MVAAVPVRLDGGQLMLSVCAMPVRLYRVPLCPPAAASHPGVQPPLASAPGPGGLAVRPARSSAGRGRLAAPAGTGGLRAGRVPRGGEGRPGAVSQLRAGFRRRGSWAWRWRVPLRAPPCLLPGFSAPAGLAGFAGEP